MRCASRSASPVRWPVAVHEFRAGRRRCASSAVLFETLTGEVPHAGPTVQAVIARVTTIEKRSATAVRPPNPRILRHLWAARSIAPPAVASPDVDAFIAALDAPDVGEGAERPVRRPLSTSGQSIAALVGAAFVAAALGFTAGWFAGG